MRLEGWGIVAALRAAEELFGDTPVQVVTDAQTWARRYGQLEALASRDWRWRGKSVRDRDILAEMYSYAAPYREVIWQPRKSSEGSQLAHAYAQAVAV